MKNYQSADDSWGDSPNNQIEEIDETTPQQKSKTPTTPAQKTANSWIAKLKGLIDGGSSQSTCNGYLQAIVASTTKAKSGDHATYSVYLKAQEKAQAIYDNAFTDNDDNDLSGGNDWTAEGEIAHRVAHHAHKRHHHWVKKLKALIDSGNKEDAQKLLAHIEKTTVKAKGTPDAEKLSILLGQAHDLFGKAFAKADGYSAAGAAGFDDKPTTTKPKMKVLGMSIPVLSGVAIIVGGLIFLGVRSMLKKKK